MTAATLLIRCPQCGLKFRVVTSYGTIHVTCPGCRAQWDWQESGSPAKPALGPLVRAVLGKMRGQMRDFWQVAVLRPRLSYAGSAVVLLAGLGLGVYFGHGQRTPAASESPPPLAFTNLPPLIGPVKPSGTNRATNAGEILPMEALLPSNGVDFKP
ncbi:MAG: hypothetical protein ABSH38_10385 [Verrucomicrobiota bacterium]|jgi:hypothetical protein